MKPRGQRMPDGPRNPGAIGLGFRLAWYAVLVLICGILVGSLYLMSLLD